MCNKLISIEVLLLDTRCVLHYCSLGFEFLVSNVTQTCWYIQLVGCIKIKSDIAVITTASCGGVGVSAH